VFVTVLPPEDFPEDLSEPLEPDFPVPSDVVMAIVLLPMEPLRLNVSGPLDVSCLLIDVEICFEFEPP